VKWTVSEDYAADGRHWQC